MYRKLICMLAIAAPLLIGSQPLWAASVTLALQGSEARAGETINVPVIVEKAQGMGSLEFEVSFDPAVLAFVSLEQADMLPGAIVSSNVAEPGRLIVALVSSDRIQGDGALLTLKYNVIAATPGASSLVIEKARAWEHGPDLLEMLASSRAAEIVVIASPMFPPWYWVVGGIGLVLVVGVVFLVKRARKPGVVHPR